MHQPTLDALRSGAAADALNSARANVASAPQDPTSHRLLAAALRLGGDSPAALAAIDQAIALAPDDANLHLERAGLLLNARQLSEAEGALARTIGLDPNQFPAYIIQAQLALSRGDLDEAERIVKTASRIAPEHPQVAAIEGMLALRRGDADSALKILSAATERYGDEPTLQHALGFAYLAKGHFAFAEQVFRRTLERQPGSNPSESRPLRALLADLVRRQGRPGDAADELAPLLNDATPGLHTMYGELQLQAGRNDAALEPLRAAFAAQPTDQRTLRAMVEAWNRTGAVEEARSALDVALAAHPQVDLLWRARLVFEPFAGDTAQGVVERWLAAVPDHIPALEARATVHDRAGETDEADAIAYQIVALEPGHTQAELRIIDALLKREPDQAVQRIDALLAKATDEGIQRSLRQLRGRCLDVAGRQTEAAAEWAAVQAESTPQRLPLPPVSAPRSEWPELAPLPDPAPGVLLLWGAPGSLVERIAVTFDLAGAPLRADRFGANPPTDPLQRYGVAEALADGSLDPAFAVAQWRAALPARGVPNGQIFDWLLWWDNALLLALRPHLPEAVLMIALRDPRDMLLDWLAHGAPVPFALESPDAGARWLAQVLAQVADLHEQDLFPHRLLRLDDIGNDPVAVAQAIGTSLNVEQPPAPPQAFVPHRFDAGHWRTYAEPLVAAFALLTPVAVRLGYSEA